MPVNHGKDEKGCYAQWGQQTKYYYECDNEEAKEEATKKAETQGKAIKSQPTYKTSILKEKLWLVNENYIKILLNADDKILNGGYIGKDLFIKDSIYQENDGIAIIDIQGLIAEIPILYEYFIKSTHPNMIKHAIKMALNDNNIKTIILKFDTPGGSVSHNFELAEFIYESKAKKPILSLVVNATSAGTLLACAAEKVYLMEPVSIMGSIGVVTSLSEKDVDEISYPENKRMDLQSENGKIYAKKRIVDIFNIFADKMLKYRGISKEKIVSLDGLTFIGEENIINNLADEIVTTENDFLLKIKNEVKDMSQKTNTENNDNLEAEMVTNDNLTSNLELQKIQKEAEKIKEEKMQMEAELYNLKMKLKMEELKLQLASEINMPFIEKEIINNLVIKKDKIYVPLETVINIAKSNSPKIAEPLKTKDNENLDNNIGVRILEYAKQNNITYQEALNSYPELNF